MQNEKGVFTNKLFGDWLIDDFDEKMHEESRKVLLFLDNAGVHPRDLNLKATTLVFLPPGLTDYLQPLDTGIFSKLKMMYK